MKFFKRLINTLPNRIPFFIWFLIALLFLVNALFSQTATYYADKYEGRRTANGDIFRQNKLTCASNDYRIGTILRVKNGTKAIDVRVNDRMHDSIHKVIDLSKSAFKLISDTAKGRIKVKIKIIKK